MGRAIGASQRQKPFVHLEITFPSASSSSLPLRLVPGLPGSLSLSVPVGQSSPRAEQEEEEDPLSSAASAYPPLPFALPKIEGRQTSFPIL